MAYKYFFLKEPGTVGGKELKARECYKMTEEVYDEVMALCRDFKAVITFEKVTIAPPRTRPVTIRQREDAKKEAAKEETKPEKKSKQKKEPDAVFEEPEEDKLP